MRESDFEQWYAEHAEPLLGFLTMRTGDRALAEDLVAETFVRVLKAGRKFDRRRATVKTWIYSIALNLLRDHARRRGAEERAVERTGAVLRSGGGVSDGWTDAVEDRELVERALERLSPEEREVIALRFGGDLTVPEIAKLLGEPLQRVEGRVYRALRKLRDDLP